MKTAVASIYHKEWLKLRWALAALALINLGAAAYYWFRLDFLFHSVEPSAMLWYRFAQLADKPYLDLTALFLLAAVVIALCQFLPEAVVNRTRILTHLPFPLTRLVAHHLLAGGGALLLCNALLGLPLVLLTALYYPPEIALVGAKDCLFRLLPALACYLGLSAAIIERHAVRRTGKLLLAVGIALLALKTRVQAVDLWIIPLLLWLAWSVYDAFLSVKSRHLRHPLYLAGAAALLLLLPTLGVLRYQQEFRQEFHRYYIFYSPLLQTFVYQQNGKAHNFTYGTPESTFDRQSYEEALPFVFWRNLEIQGRLPVTVAGESFDRERIRDSRQSLQYHPDDRRAAEVPLYPLFNPLGDRGMLAFPTEALAVQRERIEVYGPANRRNPKLAAEINEKLAAAGVSFPLAAIWGRTSSMKPFDWGYFVKDSRGKIFNLRRADHRVTVAPVPLPDESAEIVYMEMAENRQGNFYGYAITAADHLLLIGYPDYRLIPLPLAGFDHQQMRFQLLADPLQYLVRYDDGETYRAALFSRDYQLLGEVALGSNPIKGRPSMVSGFFLVADGHDHGKLSVVVIQRHIAAVAKADRPFPIFRLHLLRRSSDPWLGGD